MQTAKIKIGELYALAVATDRTVRFKVNSITTTSVRTTRGVDTTNIINGIIEETDFPGASEEARKRSVAPDVLQGHYTEFAELKAKQEEQDRIREEAVALREANRKALQTKLCEMAAIPLPDPGDTRGYGHPIQDNYMGVVISDEAIAKLLAAWEEAKRESAC